MSLEQLVRVSDNGLIDTNDSEAIRNYRHNLMFLTEKALQEKRVKEFRIIREDDFFPYDSMWRVNSRDTYLEYAPSNLAAAIREAAVDKLIDDKKLFKASFPIPHSKEEERLAYEMLDPRLGFVLEPVKYRSTKHFTINTALEYTGSSNQVSMKRKIVVIDDMNNFCNSGYGYSVDYYDAYLDITHENLPISKNAIYLINEDDYNEMMKDSVMVSQLLGKKVIRYRGDLAVAINMVLTEEGVLPLRVRGEDRDYVPELEDIFKESMIEFAFNHNLAYAQSHGNIDRKGGHFSDLLDVDNEERTQFETDLSLYIRQAIPELNNEKFNIYKDAKRIISIVGYEKLWRVVEEYNNLQKVNILERVRKYDTEHSVDLETHELFVEALAIINSMFRTGDVSLSTEQLFCRFFHSRTVEEQKKAALAIIDLVNSYANKP